MSYKLYNFFTKKFSLTPSSDSVGSFLQFENGIKQYYLTTAITANTTTTTAIAGSLAITSHSSGRGKMFYSDGSKWQLINT